MPTDWTTGVEAVWAAAFVHALHERDKFTPHDLLLPKNRTRLEERGRENVRAAAEVASTTVQRLRESFASVVEGHGWDSDVVRDLRDVLPRADTMVAEAVGGDRG